ncbi:O-antigen ligase family protein [Flavihumibacter rivuli]|uniref:O-antigen ligase family protein n=1 Tax=Flavihumibacter rivuli TaxID=2838156 RepID=UPI001BDEC281|nr:O-antigen ligase family protein [Flavihumibacter rivuli]ULQ56465.1 O-antigen ligase family protein [Flavihumibacter rivuli]
MLNYLILKDVPSAGRGRKDAGLYAILAVFYISLFLARHPVINNIAIVGIFVYSFFYSSWKERLASVGRRPALVFMLAFGLWQLLSFAWSANRAEASVMLGMRAPLLIFPLSLGLISIPAWVRNRFLFLMAMVMAMVAIICFIAAIRNWQNTGDSGFLYNDALTGILGHQSIYIALLTNLVLFGAGWLLYKKEVPSNLAGWLWMAILILLPFHFMLASRMAIIVLYAVVGSFVVWQVLSKKMVLEGATLLIGLLIAGFLLYKFSPKTLNRFRELAYTNYDFKSQAKESHYNGELNAEQWNGANIRLAVWECGKIVGKENLWLGTGIGDKMDELLKVYASKDFVFGVTTRRNLHNNYLDAWVTLGLVGLVLLVAGWVILPLIGAVRNGFGWGALVIIAFACSYVSETYFDRSIGNVMTGFFICLALAMAYGKEAKTTTG